MNIEKRLWDALRKLPEVEVPGLRLGSDSHRDMQHLANRRCAGCMAETVGITLRDALAEGMTVAETTKALMAALHVLGYDAEQSLQMIRGGGSFKRIGRKR